MRPRSVISTLATFAFGSLPVLACNRGVEPQPAAQAAAEEGRRLPDADFPAVTEALLTQAEAAGTSWLVYGGAYNNQRYSTLAQINRENVQNLVPVWVYQTGVPKSFETTPVVVGNTMYITTPESRVVALNAATGEKQWEYIPRLGTTIFCCGPNNRGVAVYGDKVYVATLDARLIALNNRTGQELWNVEVADPDEGYSETMAPLAYDGKVFIGVSGGEYGIRGFVTAYDAETGEEVWRWYTIPAPNEAPNGWWGEWKQTTPFGTPLNRNILEEKEDSADHADAWEHGGGAVWMTPAYDPASNTLFFGVSNPSPDLDGSVRPGDNLYTESIVALDGNSGELKWYFQYLPHDVWDLGAASPPILFEQDGRKRVGFAGKTGWFYVVDAATGKPVLRSQNFVPQQNLFAHPTDRGVRMLPGANGGSQWSPVAYSPRTGLAYVLALHQPMLYTVRPTPYQEGRLWLGGTFRTIPGEAEWGVFSAIDVRTGQIRWQRQTPVPMIGGALATAGGLVFAGQGSGTFDAFDAQSGELLWQFPAGAGVHGGPMTYMVQGVQYVAVAAGGSLQLDTPRGDDLYVFALRQERPAALRRYRQPSFQRGEVARIGEVRQVPAAALQQPAPRPAARDTAGSR